MNMKQTSQSLVRALVGILQAFLQSEEPHILTHHSLLPHHCHGRSLVAALSSHLLKLKLLHCVGSQLPGSAPQQQKVNEQLNQHQPLAVACVRQAIPAQHCMSQLPAQPMWCFIMHGQEF